MVRAATLQDLAYIESLRRKEWNALGFVASSFYEAVINRCGQTREVNGRIWLCEENGDRVGFTFITLGTLGGSAKVLQACVQEDARRLDFGRQLMEVAEEYVRSCQRSALELRVATDLEARRFWDALNFPLVRMERNPNGRAIERRHKVVANGLFESERGAA